MIRIIYAVGAAIFFIKGINAMTDQTAGKNVWFRMFRAVLWCALSAVAVSAAVFSVSWALNQIFLMWGNNV